jgi:hypothetical protein
MKFLQGYLIGLFIGIKIGKDRCSRDYQSYYQVKIKEKEYKTID